MKKILNTIFVLATLIIIFTACKKEDNVNTVILADDTLLIAKVSSNAIKDGETLIIEGGHFGTHPNKPIYYDDYRDANLGANALEAGLMNLGSDEKGWPIVVEDKSVSGEKSLRMDYGIGEYNGAGMFPRVGVTGFPSTQKLYVSSWSCFTRYQSGTPHKAVMKRVRAGYGEYYHGKPGFFDTEFFGDVTNSTDSFYEGWIAAIDRGYTDSSPLPHYPRRYLKEIHYKKMDTWHRTDYYMDMGDIDVANGEFRNWLDGQENEQVDGLLVRMDGFDGGFEWVMSEFCGWDSYGTDNAYYLWMDCFYISTTQARVELGDNEDFDACNVRYIQPSVNWTDTELEIDIRTGTLSGQCYLFVVDEKGAASVGFPINID